MRWLVVIALIGGCGDNIVPPPVVQPVTIDNSADASAADIAAWNRAFGGAHHRQWRDLCNMFATLDPGIVDDPSCATVVDGTPPNPSDDEWSINEWAMALASMYDLTADVHYLDELGELGDVLVAARSEARGVVDPVRGRTDGGWVIQRGDCTWGSLEVTGLLAGVLARYSRLVAEHSELDAERRDRATTFAAAAARALSDIPADERRGDATTLLYLISPAAPAACTALINHDGAPYPYNMQHLVFGAMLDLVVAREDGVVGPDLDALVAIATSDVPRLWQQWQGDAVRTAADGTITFARWPTGQSPDGVDRIEDSSHAAVTIELLYRLGRDRSSLENTMGSWPATDALRAGIAATLVMHATEQQDGTWEFPGDMDGGTNTKVYDRAQRSCAGWAWLAIDLGDAWQRCADVSLAEITGDQSNATAGDVATLLRTKAFPRHGAWIAWRGEGFWDPSGPAITGPAFAGDLDGDGEADLVAVADGHVVVAWSGRGELAGQAIAGTPVAVADVDGDGIADIVVDTDGELRAYLGRRGARVVSATAHDVAQSFGTPIFVADCDGDGVPDLLTIVGGTIRIAAGIRGTAAHGAWRDAGTTTVAPDGIHVADLDGDHRADLVRVADGHVEVAFATASGFAAWATIGSLDAPSIQIADIDGNGTLDIIGFGPAGWIVAHGGHTLSAPMLIDALAASSVIVGDFDGDGAADVMSLR